MLSPIWIRTVRHLDGIEKIQRPKSKNIHNNKAVFENPKAYQNSKYTFSQIFNFLIFEQSRLIFEQPRVNI